MADKCEMLCAIQDKDLETEQTPCDMDIISEMNVLNRELDTTIAEEDGEGNMAALHSIATHGYNAQGQPKHRKGSTYYRLINHQLMWDTKSHVCTS